MNKVVITGYGVVTPYGVGVKAMMEGIANNTNCFIDIALINIFVH